MNNEITQKLISSLPESLIIQDDKLSSREMEVLCLIAKGYRNKEVARKLFLSISTVKSHIHHIYEKLHVSSRIEAVNKMRIS